MAFDRVTVSSVQVEHYNHVLGAENLTQDPLITQAAVLQTHPLVSEDLTNTGTLTEGAITHFHGVGAGDIRGPTKITAGAVDTQHNLSTTDLNGTSTIQQGAVVIPYGITKVYAQDSGTYPIYWGELAVIEGKFGPLTDPPGQVHVDTVQGTVNTWTDSQITFYPNQGGLGYNGTYAVYVRRVTNS